MLLRIKFISALTRMLLFESDRPGGLGSWDLWQVSIEPVDRFANNKLCPEQDHPDKEIREKYKMYFQGAYPQ